MEHCRIDDDDVMSATESSQWEQDYFKKFDWLSDSRINQMDFQTKTYYILEYLSRHMQLNTGDPELNLMNPETAKLYLYYIELENYKMILHAAFKKPFEEILQDCEKIYEFARINRPIRVVYIMHDIDVYDVDKNVKLFMHMFGVDSVRGGSYDETMLPDYVIKTLEREFSILDIEHYINQERQSSIV
jgi:hypothetical protein